MYRLFSALGLLAMAFAPGCFLRRTLPPPSGSPNDALYRKQRFARQDYSETAVIQACPESSKDCRTVAAELVHHFESSGKEDVLVQRIEVSRGQFINFKATPIPGRAEDSQERGWRLKW